MTLYAEIVTWFFVVVVLVGLFLNARRHWSGFIFWMVSNVYWFWHTYRMGEDAQAVLFATYFIFSAYGIYAWRKKQKSERKHDAMLSKILGKLLHDNSVLKKALRGRQSASAKKHPKNVVRNLLE